MFDGAQIQSGWRQSAIRENPQTAALPCVELTTADGNQFNRQEVHSSHAYGAPRALLILEA